VIATGVAGPNERSDESFCKRRLDLLLQQIEGML
jgi:hypothetical protein